MPAPKWLIKGEEASISPYGRYPGARPIEQLLKNGIIILDKPPGPTSHQVDSWIKQILAIEKCSHGGTLDPRVSGVLVIALENATKLMPILLGSAKEYVAIIHLHKEIDVKRIERVCKKFIGKIKQLPPVKAAVARRERVREIYYLKILEIDGRNILMRVGCEAGTYIRRLATQIGDRLGIGAHLLELRRTRSGVFTEDRAVTLQALCDAVALWREKNDETALREIVLPLEAVADSMRTVLIKDSAIEAICSGAPLAVGGILRIQSEIKPGDWVGMLSLRGELIAIGKALMTSKQMFMAKKGLAIKTDRVLMPRGTYPKMWS
jgi:H/ACA ribonucleoprotein complex subunit 4